MAATPLPPWQISVDAHAELVCHQIWSAALETIGTKPRIHRPYLQPAAMPIVEARRTAAWRIKRIQ
eukprot:10452457-Lingulodinium_polyedra.AAC.1